MIVATPVLERVGGRSVTVAGGGRHAAYAEDDGFVVALTAPGVPLMPNGVGLTGPPPAAGTEVTIAAHETWDPTLSLGDDAARRGDEILAALRRDDLVEPELLRAVAKRDRSLAATAARRLIGRGPGLTPEGDDVLAATAAVVAAGPWSPATKAGWLDAVVPSDLRKRTTALSATLLELAAAGRVIEPVHGLFGDEWGDALARLTRLGHSTGRAYAAAAAATARLLAP
jgi:Protein of unknown function (DUF2877)